MSKRTSPAARSPRPCRSSRLSERRGRRWSFHTAVERRLFDGKVPKRRLLFRIRRRAKARAETIEALEASFRLEGLQAKVDVAELEELTRELFASPATTMAAVLVQAKELSAYAETIEAGHAAHEAGRFCTQLATGLLNVARAA